MLIVQLLIALTFQQSFRASIAAEADRIIYHTFPTKASECGPWLLTHD